MNYRRNDGELGTLKHMVSHLLDTLCASLRSALREYSNVAGTSFCDHRVQSLHKCPTIALLKSRRKGFRCLRARGSFALKRFHRASFVKMKDRIELIG